MQSFVIISLGAGLDTAAIAALPPGDTLTVADADACAGLSTRARALAAVALWKKHPAARLLFSGRGVAPDRITEAETMRAVALQAGVPAEAISVEPGGPDTAGSVARCARMLRADPDLASRSVLLVTGERHLARAARYFRAHGISVAILATHEVLLAHPELGFGPRTDRPVPGLRRACTEGLLRLLELADPQGKAVTWLAGRLRG